MQINPYAGMKVGGGAASTLSGAYESMCKKLPDALGGPTDKDCRDGASKIDEPVRRVMSDGAIIAEDAVVNKMRVDAAKVDWENTKLAIKDSYMEAAVKKAGGDKTAAEHVKVIFVDKDGKETDKVPDMRDPYESLRVSGALRPAPNVGVNVVDLTVTPPEPYVSKYAQQSGVNQ